MTEIKVDTGQLRLLKIRLDNALSSIDSDGDDHLEIPSIGPFQLDNAARSFHSDSESAFRSAKRDVGLIGEAIEDIVANFEHTDTELTSDLAEQNAQTGAAPGAGGPV